MRVIRSLLHPDDLARFVEAEYEIALPVEVRLLRHGFNDAYLVADAAGTRRVLRIYSRDKYWIRSTSDLHFEVEMLDRLASADRRVCRPVRRRNGDLLGHLDAPEGARSCVLMAFAPGMPASQRPMDMKQLRTFGSEIAHLHAAMDTFTSEHTRYHLDVSLLIDMPLAAIEQHVCPGQTSAYAEIRTLAEKLSTHLQALPTTAPAYGLIHADIHDGNVHVTTDGEFNLFDFDHCGYGWRAYDLTNLYRSSDAPEQEQGDWKAVLTGYESVRPLSPPEREALPALTACRALWDIGDWIRAAQWNGMAWTPEQLCDQTLERLRKPLVELGW